MKVTIQIIISIRSKPQGRKFRKFLEVESNHKDLLLHNEVRWLRKGHVLAMFREVLPEVRTFLLERQDDYAASLKSKEWLLKLAFLTAVSLKLNDINTELQGKARSISDIFSSFF